jgi:hypothetical protein
VILYEEKCDDFIFQWVSQNVGAPGGCDEALGNLLGCKSITLIDVKNHSILVPLIEVKNRSI